MFFPEVFLTDWPPLLKYNPSDHPIAFHKAQDLGKTPKKLAGGPAPDLEEAFLHFIPWFLCGVTGGTPVNL